MPATISHALSATTPDNTSYEIRPSHWNSVHNITLAPSGAEVIGAFSNSNGISFGTEAGGGVTASYTVPTVPASYVSQVNGSSGALSFATGSSLSSSQNGSSITWGLASNITTALQSANANYLTSQSNQAFSAQGGSSAFQTLAFTNSNGISFSNTNGSIWGSHNGLTSQSNQAFSAQGGSSGFQTLTFTNSNGVSFSNTNGSIWASVASQSVQTQASGAIAGSGFTSAGANISLSGTLNSAGFSLSASVAAGGGTNLTAYAQSNSTQSSSGTIAFSSMNFAGAGAASVGISNGSVVISVPVGAGGADGYNIVSMLSSTSGGVSAGATFSNSAASIGLMAGSGIQLSQTSNTIVIGQTPSFTALSYQNRQLGASVTVAAGNDSLWLAPTRIVAPVSASTIVQMIVVSGTASSNQTNTFNATVQMGLYQQTDTANLSKMDSLWSSTYGMTLWNSGTASVSYSIDGGASGQQTSSSSAGSTISSLYHGVRLLTHNVNSTFGPGLYAYALKIKTATTGASSLVRSFAPVMDNPLASGGGLGFGTATNASIGYADGGTWSVTTANLPASFNLTDIKQTMNMVPFFKMGAI